MDQIQFAKYRQVIEAIARQESRPAPASGRIKNNGFIIRLRFKSTNLADQFSLSLSAACPDVSILSDGPKVSIYAGDCKP